MVQLNARSRKASKHNRVEAIQSKPLEPIEYCRRWSEHPENEYGYIKQWSQDIASVTGYTVRAAEAWLTGYRECPQPVKMALRKQDILNQIRQLLRSIDEIQE